MCCALFSSDGLLRASHSHHSVGVTSPSPLGEKNSEDVLSIVDDISSPSVDCEAAEIINTICEDVHLLNNYFRQPLEPRFICVAAKRHVARLAWR